MLPEDMIIEILSWAPPMWLHQHARHVCKTWATIIATFEFAQLNLHRACSKPPTLYLQDFMSRSTYYFMDNVDGKFVKTDMITRPAKATLLIATCDGIMLFWNGYEREHFVANPILNCVLTIPPLPTSEADSGYPQFTIIRVPYTATFKLFFAFSNVFYALAIGVDNSWKEIARRKVKRRKRWFAWKPVYSGSNSIYWPTMEAMLVIDIHKEIIVEEYPHPFPLTYPLNYPSPEYLWKGNCLSSIVCSKDYTSFKIYIFDIDSKRWSLHHEIKTIVYVAAYGREVMITNMRFCVWVDDQIIFKLIVEDPIDPNTTIFFGYNVKTRQVTKIDAIADEDFGSWMAWRHTNSLISVHSAHA